MREYALNQADQQYRGSFLGKFRQYAKNWLRRKMLKEVSDLDDHILKDIGLERQELLEALTLPLAYDPFGEVHRRVLANRRRLGHC
jgi:uncharacterized protein YjiS (DUF1127 family)